VVGIHAGVGGGEELVPVEDRVRTREEAERLALAREPRAPGGETHPGLRQRQPRRGDEPHELEDIDRRLALERRPFHRHQAVDRHALRRGIEAAQHLQQLEPVQLRFAHAHDPAATDRHPRRLHGADGLEPVLKGVGRDDLRVKLRAGIEIMVVRRNPGGPELARGLGRELPQRDAHLHAELGHLAHRLEHRLEFRIVLRHALPRRAHAKARAAIDASALGGCQDRGQRRERFPLQAGVVMGALRAISAILRAPARLDAHQRAKLHLMLRPMRAISLPRPRHQVKERQRIERPKRSQVVSQHEAPTLPRKRSSPQAGPWPCRRPLASRRRLSKPEIQRSGKFFDRIITLEALPVYRPYTETCGLLN
jgi:hypothetical protein